MVSDLIENGIEAERRKQKRFFELAEQFRKATEPSEIKRLGEELGMMVFGGRGTLPKTFLQEQPARGDRI